MSTQTLNLKSVFLIASISLLTACGGGGGSDVGSQNDTEAPIASALAIGLGNSSSSTENKYITRSNAEVLLSAKNSYSDTTPILEFSWQQIDGPSVDLIERTSNSVVFIAPNTGDITTLTFEITVIDANGVSASDQLTVDVLPINDAKHFLADPSIPDSKLNILAALQDAEDAGNSTQAFTLDVTTIAHWRNRLGEMDQLVVNTETIDSLFPANFNPAANYAPLADVRNPVLTIDLITLDIDAINKNFQDSNRDRRLDVYELSTAYLEIQINVSSTSVNLELFALDNSGNSIDQDDVIDAAVSGNSEQLAAQGFKSLPERSGINPNAIFNPSMSASTNGALLQTWNGEFSASLLTTKILAALGLESSISANAYYALIDPQGQFASFNSWLIYAGFNDANGNPIDDPEIAHATYVNNYDLGFGRDMYLRKDADGNVFSYVTNYPTLENTIEGRGDFAIVVMEYSDNPDTNGNNAKIVKFYTYVPDERSGDFVRSASMDFDGGGEKFLPGVCTACHQSNPGSRQYTTVAEADLNATFIPWDLDSLLFADAANPRQIEPTLSDLLLTPEQQAPFSLENQQQELRKLNLGALATYVANPVRNAAPIQLVHGWYGDEDMELPIDQLPDNPFNGNYVQPGWVGQEDLYHNVFARNCRICHVQIDSDENNFDTYDEFINDDLLIPYVYEQGSMPMARLTYDRFWVSFYGETSAADLLREHLTGLNFTVSEAPGLPVPKFTFNDENPTIEDVVIVDASNSSFAESFSWSLVAPNGSSSSMNNQTGLISSFNPDLPAGVYSVVLTASNDTGNQQSLSQSITIADRFPSAECLTAVTSTLSSAGLLSNIPVVSRNNNLGDGSAIISSATNGSLGSISIDNGGTTLSYQLNDTFTRGSDIISYQLADLNGSLSTTDGTCNTGPIAGFGTIIIDTTTAGTLAASALSAVVDATNNSSQININWSAPSSVTVDGYNIYRNSTANGSPLNGSAPITNTSYSDTGLIANTNYDYSVETIIAQFTSNSSTDSSRTLSLTPTNLVASNAGINISDETQIQLDWDIPEAGAATVTKYNIYRDGNAVATTPDPVTSNSYTDIGLSQGKTYSYTVNAEDGTPQVSPDSNSDTQTTRPLAPSLATLSPGIDARTVIDLSWTAPNPLNDVTNYAVHRTDTMNPLTVTALTSYSDATLTENQLYTYYVTSIVNPGAQQKESANSNSQSLTTAANGTGAPGNFAVSLNSPNDATAIDLSWQKPAAFTVVDSYNIYRTIGAGTESLLINVASLDPNPEIYTDSALTNNTLYNYRVAAVVSATERDTSSTEPITTNDLTPTGLTPTAQSTSQIDISWTSPAAAENAIIVTRDGANVTRDESTCTPTPCTSDSGLTAGTAYTYAVIGTQGADSSFDTIVASTRPSDPANLALSFGTVTTASIVINWTAASGNVDSYSVYRNDDGYNTPILTGVAGITTTDIGAVRGIASGTDYTYRVYAVANGIESANPAEGTATTTPAPPVLNTATAVSTSRIDLSWTAPSGNTSIDSYNIYRNGNSTALKTGIAGTASFDDTGSAGTLYNYTVRAVANGEISANSNSVSGATLPSTPAVSVTVSDPAINGADVIRVSGYGITCNGDAPTYTITSSGTGAPAPVTTSAVTLDLSGHNSNTPYSVTVQAECNDVDSATSSTANATTEYSYADSISPLAASYCVGCHFTHTANAVSSYFKTLDCASDNLNYGDCDTPSMGVLNFSAGDFTIINNWNTDGRND